jgi:hypothetical protein
MARVHFLNVGQGDCCIIEHVSRRTTLVDICKGNLSEADQRSAALIEQIFGSNRSTEISACRGDRQIQLPISIH